MKALLSSAVVVCALLLFLPRCVFAEDGQAGHAVVVTLFWGKGCPHCEKEMQFLDSLKQRHPQLSVRMIEVWKDKKNAELYKRILASSGIKAAGVPGTVIGNKILQGFTEEKGRIIEGYVARCISEECPDALASLDARGLVPEGDGTIAIPLFGTVDPGRMSLPVFTVVIAGLDSFNPCAFFVLLFLLSLMIHARSRARMAFIGGTFVFFSGLIYFLFMAAWLNIFMIIGQLTAITLVGGIIAIVVGAVNIKDFFWFKQGMSLMIPESAKPKLFTRMRDLLKAPTIGTMMAGTIVLAITANAYELLCTAGFPMVYTRVLTLQNLTPEQYYAYLGLYNVIYVIPLAAIVSVMTVSLGARRLSEWQGRQLKLLSGLMMLSLGVLLAVDPALLNNVLSSVMLLAGVLAVSWLVIVVTKRMKPEMTA
ncbi:MAG: hypothetical protein M0042_07670 [Nitrospiraceae bacterium]|nr:hypothetical protein [Nitrospiraceae bacterium]